MKKVIAVELWGGSVRRPAGRSFRALSDLRTFETSPSDFLDYPKEDFLLAKRSRFSSSDVVKINPEKGLKLVSTLGTGNFMTVALVVASENHGYESDLLQQHPYPVVLKQPKEPAFRKRPISQANLERAFTELDGLERAGISCVPILNSREDLSANRRVIMRQINQADFLSNQGHSKEVLAELLFTLFAKVIHSWKLPDQPYFVVDFKPDNLSINPVKFPAAEGTNVERLVHAIEVPDTISDHDWSEHELFGIRIKDVYKVLGLDLTPFRGRLSALANEVMNDISANRALHGNNARLKIAACEWMCSNL